MELKQIKEVALFRLAGIRSYTREHVNYLFEDYYKQYMLIYIHIPKTGGTSISKALYGKEDHHFSARELQFFQPIKFSKYYKFSIVRHPFDRIISMFKYIQTHRELNQFQDLDIPYNIEEFIMDFLTRKIIKYQYFFWSQKSYLCNHSGSINHIDYIGKFEFLSNSFHYINSQFNLGSSLTWENKSLNQVNISEKYLKELQERVYNLYKHDYHSFDYELYHCK